ncbi:MAG: DegT/DnrJ/EryC1/StrS family aminotransferase [Spirochaetales bacterium]|jgi:dTDP-4-amino-4,6-dideoxygalactose transaminase|nr:DegT/DnrJ/EryC1/StrS family aminotransferase [Spirochaetales bacterium]
MNRNTDFIPFARPDIGRGEEEAVLRVLRSGWLTTASEAKSFEEEFARYVGSPYALAVNSATAGLHLALEALGTGPGDRVITSPYTFTATAGVIRHLGADPLFVDIAPGTFHIDPQGIENAIARENGGKAGEKAREKGTIRAILPIHVGGEVWGMPEIAGLSREYGIPVVEDSAHAFPSRTAGGFAGTLGGIGVYSFYATKTITTGEGGMVVTRNQEAAKRMDMMRLHGIDREVWNRYTEKGASWRYAVMEAGFKYNMTDIAAALGRVQLGRAGEFLEKRKEIAARYRRAFAERDYLIPPRDAEGHAWHLFLLRIDGEKLSISRDDFIDKLQEAGIGTSVHFIPLHLHPYYGNRYGFKAEDFPAAYAAYQQVISLPIYPAMREDQVRRVIDAVIRTGDSARGAGRHRQ